MDCIFCKIVAGDIPSSKVYDDETIYAFTDINPLSEGHTLFITKDHFTRLDDASDEALMAILPAIKKVANAAGIQEYNVLQNNGKMAGQEVNHLHFHLIPKPDKERGLKMILKPDKTADQAAFAERIKELLY